MNPEIKQRIEQIQQGEVPEGYQKTSVGIIPSEWEIRALSQLMHFKNGINADKSKFGKGTRLISVCDLLKDSPIYYDTIIGMVDISDAQQKEFSVTYGDILFQRSSENYEDAGTSNVYLDHTSTATFSGFIIRGKKIANYNPVYLNALLRTSKIRKSIVRLAAGAQHINIGQDSLASVKIPFANDLEQKKIAAILTTQDKVIELKEKRLAEKQRQKKYLMQQLLTGKKRLPGFVGKWRIFGFNEIFTTISTKGHQINKAEYETEGRYPVVDQGKQLIAGYSNKTEKVLVCPKDGLVVFGDHTREIKFINFDFIVGADGTQLLTAKSENAGINYLFYYLLNKEIHSDGYSRHFKYVKEFTYRLPPLEEQSAIVKILSAVDREIDLLRQDIEQEKQKKKALMQLLLTGIVRVKT